MADLNEIMDQLDAETVLDMRGVDYREQHGTSGWQLNIRECPSCGNTNWKVYIGAESGAGNCFRCDKKFSLFSFVQMNEGLSGRDTFKAFEQMANEVGWMPKQESKKVQFSAELTIPNSINLPDNDGNNLLYLADRNVGPDLCRYFHLKFCEYGSFNYEMAGESRYQNYNARVIIPIFDIDGKLASFQGRDVSGFAERKYLFPPGFSSTASLLFNSHNAIGAKRVCIGEGVFDVIAIKRSLDHDSEFRDVVPVGTFGKNFTIRGESDQLGVILQLKEKGLQEVIFMWDGETEAVKAAINTALELSRYGLKTRVAILPKGTDPDEAGDEIVRASFRASKLITPLTAAAMLMTLK